MKACRMWATLALLAVEAVHDACLTDGEAAERFDRFAQKMPAKGLPGAVPVSVNFR